MKKPSIRLRYGALNDDVVVDGHVFVRHQLTRKEQAFLRNVVIDSLIKAGAINRRGRAHA